MSSSDGSDVEVDDGTVACVICGKQLPLNGAQPDTVVDRHIEANCASPEPVRRRVNSRPEPNREVEIPPKSSPIIDGEDGGWRVLPQSLKPHGDWVMGVEFVSNRSNLILTSSIQGDIKLHDITELLEQIPLEEDPHEMNFIDSHMKKGYSRLFNDAEKFHVTNVHSNWVRRVRSSPSGMLFTSAGDDGGAVVKNLETQQTVAKTEKLFPGYCYESRFVNGDAAGENLIVAVGDPRGEHGNQGHLFDLRSKRVERRFSVSESKGGEEQRRIKAQAVETSVSGDTVLLGTDKGTLESFDIGTGKSQRQFRGTDVNAGVFYSCQYLEDHGLMWAGTNSGATVWDLNSDSEVGIRAIRGNSVREVSMSRMGVGLIAIGNDGVAIVEPDKDWGITQTLKPDWTHNNDSVKCAVMNSEGTQIVMGTDHGCLYVYRRGGGFGGFTKSASKR